MTIDPYSFYKALDKKPATIMKSEYRQAKDMIDKTLNNLFGSHLVKLGKARRRELLKKIVKAVTDECIEKEDYLPPISYSLIVSSLWYCPGCDIVIERSLCSYCGRGLTEKKDYLRLRRPDE